MGLQQITQGIWRERGVPAYPHRHFSPQLSSSSMMGSVLLHSKPRILSHYGKQCQIAYCTPGYVSLIGVGGWSLLSILQERSRRNSNYHFLSLFSAALHVCSVAQLCPTVAYHAPLSIEFSRQEHRIGLPFLSRGDLLDPGIELASPALAG